MPPTHPSLDLVSFTSFICLFEYSLWSFIIFQTKLLNLLSGISTTSMLGFGYWSVVNFGGLILLWFSSFLLFYAAVCVFAVMDIYSSFIWGGPPNEQPSLEGWIASTIQRRENKPS
jgi:hypothetical protein